MAPSSTTVNMLNADGLSSAIVDAWDGLIYVGSSDYRIRFLNRRFIEQLGRDATGERCYEALHGRSAPCDWCPREVFEGPSSRKPTASMPPGLRAPYRP